jgi:predicted transcriptional regulator
VIKIGTLVESIIELLKTEDGFTDREITDRIKGKSEPQQSINMACRKLASKGMINRNTRSDGLLGNFLNAKQSVQQVANFTTVPLKVTVH